MNIFAIDLDIKTAVQYHIDKHVVKMIQEYAQLLSTAHRVRDGKPLLFQISHAEVKNYKDLGVRVKPIKKEILLPGETVFFDNDLKSKTFGWNIGNQKCFRASHHNHPSAIWARHTDSNYLWLYELFEALCEEKQHRYPSGTNETYKKYASFLKTPPVNIKSGPRTLIPPAVGDLKYDPGYSTDADVVEIYRRFYVKDKLPFAKWTNRPIPSWFIDKIEDEWSSRTEELSKIFVSEKLQRKTSITPEHVSHFMKV